MIFKTTKQAERQLRYWQKVLRLQDWDVKVRICRAYDMKPDTSGYVSAVHENKTARIDLLDPIDFGDGAMWPQDHEQTLVHELVHLHTLPVVNAARNAQETCLEHFAEEQCVESLASALIALHRKRI